MDAAPDVGTAVAMYEQLCELRSSAGMKARKWLSNSPEVLSRIPVEDRTSQIDLDKNELPTIKTLGVMWLAQRDQFTFSVSSVDEDTTITKRMFLQHLAKVFDPLGSVSPFIVQGKLIMQELWASEVDRDDPINPALQSTARHWFEDLPQLTDVAVPRCIRKPARDVALHTFVDASSPAYGAVVYARSQDENGGGECHRSDCRQEPSCASEGD